MCLDYHTLPRCSKKANQCAEYNEKCAKQTKGVCLDRTFKLNLEDETDRCPWETDICH